MKIHQQFDLNLNALNPKGFHDIPRAINEVPVLVERMINELLEKGYIVIESSAKFMGVPQSITIIKDFTGPFVTQFSLKTKEDFKAVSRALGIERLFE
ncbi:hypothetical protein HYX02_06020 [Candidatus Woesearchaeota archaeon]|nr:hypothetical protein [Candidatus Woesearchaeota archaeon]